MAGRAAKQSAALDGFRNAPPTAERMSKSACRRRLDKKNSQTIENLPQKIDALLPAANFVQGRIVMAREQRDVLAQTAPPPPVSPRPLTGS
jgi:hypothetical protein